MKLLLALGSAALLTAACASSAGVSGSGAGAEKSAKTVQVASGANAGTDPVGDNDVNRVNPVPGKAGTPPRPPAQPRAAVAPSSAAPIGVVQDRCGGMIGNPPASGNRGTPSKPPQMPACMPQ